MKVLAAVLILIPSAVLAEYVVTGPVEGQVCWGIGVEVCSMKRIAAVKGRDGRLHELATTFKSVSEYSESNKRCWIRTKSEGLGIFSLATNSALQPTFYEKDKGEYKKLDVGYLTFPCREQ